MGDKFSRQSIGSGVHFSSVRDKKFKHNRLSVNFIMPLDKATASDNAAVPFILRNGCRELPDFSSLNARLCELYGASLDADVSKSGGWQVLELSIKGLDNRFALENENITALCADLLASVALDPKLGEDGLFDAKDVALQRQFVLDSIDAEINEKRSYALSRCIQTMCAGEPVAVRKYGEREHAEKITPASAYAAYQQIIQTSMVEILFVGSGDPAGALEVFRTRFAQIARNPIHYQRTNLRTSADTVQEKTEEMDVSQSKLVMGLRTGHSQSVEEFNARRVFTALFGGTPFSKLFLNVREKLSLCYYCAARFDTPTGLLLVDSGVEAQNKEKAQKEILAQLTAVQKGEFTDEELFNTKLLMKNTIPSINDSLSGLEGWYLSQILMGRDISPDQDTKNIDTVTREQVIEAANAVTLDTIYFLTGNQDKEDAQ